MIEIPASQPAMVSVLIPVYADEGGLAACVHALLGQDYPADRFEVVVVDNGRNPDLSWVAKQDARFRVVMETTPGSYSARNTGIRQAQGEVLAFTDADCLPVPHWISTGVAALATDPHCGVVGGRVSLFFKSAGAPGLIESYDSLVNLDQKRYVEEEKFSVTANMFTRASTFEDVGLFNAEMRSGGDREWGNRVHHAGYAMVYAPDAEIRHPARSGFGECVTKARRVSGGNVIRMRQAGRLQNASAVLRFVLAGLSPPMTQWHRARQAVKSQAPTRRFALFILMWVFKWIRTAEAVRVLLGGAGRR